MAKPIKVFISATSADLHSFRKQVRDWVLDMGWLPIVQDHFAPADVTIAQLLRKKISECDAVIHLVGECFGEEATANDKQGDRQSYTQLEAELGRELRKRVFVVLLSDCFPYDEHRRESTELNALQQKYRNKVRAGQHLYFPCGSPKELEPWIRKLTIEIDKLRRTRWGVLFLLSFLLATAGVSAYTTWHARQTAEATFMVTQAESRAAEARLINMRAEIGDVRSILKQVAQQVSLSQTIPKNDLSIGTNVLRQVSPQDQIALALEQVAKVRGLDPVELRKAVDRFDAEVTANKAASVEDQVLVAMNRGDYSKAMALAESALQRMKDTRNESNSACHLKVRLCCLYSRAAMELEQGPAAENALKQALALINPSEDLWAYAFVASYLSLVIQNNPEERNALARKVETLLNTVDFRKTKSAVFGARSPTESSTLDYMMHLSVYRLAWREKRWPQAEKSARRVMAIFDTYDNIGYSYLDAARTLLLVLHEQERFAEAADIATAAKKRAGLFFSNALNDENNKPIVCNYLECLAISQFFCHRNSDCENNLRELIIVYGNPPAEDNIAKVINAISFLSVVLEKQGKTKESVESNDQMVRLMASALASHTNDASFVHDCEFASHNGSRNAKMLSLLDAGISLAQQLADAEKQIAESKKQRATAKKSLVKAIAANVFIAVALEKLGKTSETAGENRGVEILLSQAQIFSETDTNYVNECTEAVADGKNKAETFVKRSDNTGTPAQSALLEKEITERRTIINDALTQYSQFIALNEPFIDTYRSCVDSAKRTADSQRQADEAEKYADEMKKQADEAEKRANALEKQADEAEKRANALEKQLAVLKQLNERIKIYTAMLNNQSITIMASRRLLGWLRIAAGCFAVMASLLWVSVLLAMYQLHRASPLHRPYFETLWMNRHRKLILCLTLLFTSLASAVWARKEVIANAISGRTALWEKMYIFTRDSVSLAESVFAKTDDNVLLELENFARTAALDPKENHLDEAAAIFRQIIAVRQNEKNFDLSKMARLMNQLAAVLRKSGNLSEAGMWSGRESLIINRSKSPINTSKLQ